MVLGRLAGHKRVDQVVLAVSRLLPRRPELRLDVIGKGPELEPLRDLVAERGLERTVRLHGFLDEEAKRDLLLTQSAASQRLGRRGVGPGGHRGGRDGYADARA